MVLICVDLAKKLFGRNNQRVPNCSCQLDDNYEQNKKVDYYFQEERAIIICAKY